MTQLTISFQILPDLLKSYLLAKLHVDIQIHDSRFDKKKNKISEQYNQLHLQKEHLSHKLTCKFSCDYFYTKT